MSDPAVVVDRRPDPRNWWGGRFLTVASGVGAVVVLGWALIFGQWGQGPGPRVAQTASLTPPKPNVETLEQFRRRAEAIPDPVPVAAIGPASGRRLVADDEPDVAGPVRTVDPAADERQRKEYAALFASNVAWSRTSTGGGGTRLPVNAPDDPTQGQMPSTDDVVASVVKAMSAQAPPDAPQPPPPAPPQPAAANAPAATVARPEAGLHTVYEGTWLSGVLTNRLNGSAIGPVNVLISEPLYAADGVLVAPAGARLLGASSPVRDFGSSRLAVSFHRLLLPDGTSRSLDQFRGLSQVGEAGLKDRVNNHYLSTFGAAALIGLIQGLSQYLGSGGASGDGDDVYVVTGGVTDSTSQVTAQVMNKFLNRPPEIEIREGVRVRAYVSSDLQLPAYRRQP